MRTKRSAVEAISFPLGQKRIFRLPPWLLAIKALNETSNYESTLVSFTCIELGLE